MRYIIFLLFPLFVEAQTVTLKRVSIQTIGGTQYLCRADTSASGAISMTLVPITQAAEEIDSQIGSVQGEIAGYTAQITALQAKRQDANVRLKELQKIKNNLPPPPPAAPAAPEPKKSKSKKGK